MALNDYIINRVGGMEVMKEAAFYISDVITMRLDSIQQEYTVADEKVVRTSDLYATNARIEPTYKGKLQSYPERTSPPYGIQLNIVFEKIEGSPAIPFVKQGLGADERYRIIFTDTAEQKIDVGGATYIVNFGGNELPYLLFMLTDTVVVH